jgi:SAM-dependent methyltransferase
MHKTADTSTTGQEPVPARKQVLNAGSGPDLAKKLHPVFRSEEWRQVRLDIDPRVKPDLIGSVTDLRAVVPDGSCDAVWSSHNIEHLHAHEVRPALSEFRRVLKPDGFALITCPDLEAVAQLVVEGKLEETAYTAPAGPITALDMLFGFGASIERGNTFMAHNTGFTRDRLGHLLLECGFAEAWVTKGRMYDLWAVALMPEVDRASLKASLTASDVTFRNIGRSPSG